MHVFFFAWAAYSVAWVARVERRVRDGVEDVSIERTTWQEAGKRETKKKKGERFWLEHLYAGRHISRRR